MRMLRQVRSATASALHVTAGVLNGTAKAVDTAAQLLRPAPAPAEQVAETYVARGTVKPAPPPATDVATPTVRVPSTHIEELAEQPAADVIAQVGDLSTDELRQLAEYEQRNRRRKSVLAAIERTAEDFAS